MSAKPESPRVFLDPVALTRLGNLKLQARTVVEGALAGLHRSPHKGSSVEFAEYKEYAPGDEIRHIDWKAFAKSDKYYVKQFEEETNLRAYLLVDTSGSMDFGSTGLSKLAYAQTLAASIGHLLLRQGDAVGVLLFDERPGAYLAPSGRSTHLDDVVRVLEEAQPGHRGTDLVLALQRVAEIVRRRSLVVIISDLLDERSEAAHLLQVLRSRRMDVALFHLLDPDELQLPYEGLTIFEGLENDGDLLVDPDDIREEYQRELQVFLDGVERSAREAQVDYHRVSVDRPFEEVLLTFLQERSRRAERPGDQGTRR